MTEHDHLFKELLKTYFVEFIDLFLPHRSAVTGQNLWRHMHAHSPVYHLFQ